MIEIRDEKKEKNIEEVEVRETKTITKTKKYKCLDCGNDFKGLGKKVICPSCQSDNVEAQE